MMNIYIHTMDGKPAGFDGERLCFGWRGMPVAYSLKQLREEQQQSAQFYWDNHQQTNQYGYVLCKVEQQ